MFNASSAFGSANNSFGGSSANSAAATSLYAGLDENDGAAGSGFGGHMDSSHYGGENARKSQEKQKEEEKGDELYDPADPGVS